MNEEMESSKDEPTSPQSATKATPMNDPQESKDEIERQAKVDEQMDLALGDERLIIDYSDPPVRNYTAERFKDRYPDRYLLACRFLALGFSIEDVKRRVHSDHRTIKAVQISCVTDVNKQKEEMRQPAFAVSKVTMERAMELAPDMTNGKDLMIMHGIARDTFIALSGIPTAKIEISGHVDIHAEITHLLKEAEEKMKTVKATVVEAPMLENGESPA